MYRRPVFFVNGQSVNATLLRLWHEFSAPSRVLGFCIGAVLIVAVGPFGTFDLPFPKRAGYWSCWLACVWITTTLCFCLTHAVAMNWSVAKWKASAVSLCLTVPISAILGLSLATLFFTSIEPSLTMYVSEAKFLSPIVVGITGLLHMTMPLPVKPAMVGDVFFARLPANLGRRLVSISSADHYLRVRTDKGETLVHGSLAEAIAQLDGFSGGQIHRSHWVAYPAIEQKTWSGQRLEVRLSSGEILPVSRTYRSDLLQKLKEDAP